MLPPTRYVRAALLLCALAAPGIALAGCGSDVDADDARADTASAQTACQQTVMDTLGSVLRRVYDEGVSSERTRSAEHMIERSKPLREAIEAGDRRAARAAARELIATGHMTNLDVTTSSGSLVSAGGTAVAPLRGTIANAAGKAIARYTTSVWSITGLASEGSGIAEGLIAIRAGEREVGGTFGLPAGPLPAEGTLTRGGTVYAFNSISGRLYPSGAVRIYLVKSAAGIEKLCGASDADTQVATLERVAHLIYKAEAGSRTRVQVRRVQRNGALLKAVAAGDVAGVRTASEALLHHHLVRLRVSSGGKLLGDLGGPFVLAPVRAELRLGGRKIGEIVLSIQDDEGYLRLSERLAGLYTLMYMEGPHGSTRLVKNSLGGGSGSLGLGAVPASGAFTYRGRSFRVFTVHAEAFPSGPLTIRVLIPQPYL
jgi:hypothetical protein